MEKKNLPKLSEIKHEINNLLFKLETSIQILKEEKISEEECKVIGEILENNTSAIKILFENLILLDKLEHLQKKEISLIEYFGIKKNITASPEVLLQCIKNIQFLQLRFSIDENLNLYIKSRPEDKLKKYIFDITKNLLEQSGINLKENEDE